MGVGAYEPLGPSALRQHLRQRQNLAELAQPLGVGAEALVRSQGPGVEPEEIAPFGQGLALEPAENRDANLLKAPGQRRPLAPAQLLAHPQDHGAPVGDDHRVENTKIEFARSGWGSG